MDRFQKYLIERNPEASKKNMLDVALRRFEEDLTDKLHVRDPGEVVLLLKKLCKVLRDNL